MSGYLSDEVLQQYIDDVKEHKISTTCVLSVQYAFKKQRVPFNAYQNTLKHMDTFIAKVIDAKNASKLTKAS